MLGLIGDHFTQKRIFSLEPLTTAQCATQLQLIAYDGQQARVVPRFLDEIPCTGPHRLHGEVYGPDDTGYDAARRA